MQSSFVIIREDLQVDPITIVADSLLIGRLATCDLLLNHPSVSRLQAGLSVVGNDYFIRNLRPGNPITLNGNVIEHYTALTGGDVLGIGPFALNVDFLAEALALKVSLQIAASPREAVVRRESSTEFWEDLPTTSHLSLPGTPDDPKTLAHRKNQPRKPKPEAESSKALDVFWAKRITAATKTMKPSPLFPMRNRPAGKAQSVWTSTTDLKPKSHYLMMLVVAGVVALLASAAGLFYAKAFAPGSISNAHNRSTLTLSPVATHANSGSCTSCHSWGKQMDASCTSCHTTEAFAATVIPAHTNAGIGCVDCHGEHRGSGFNALAGALLSCFECHNDGNKRTYHGKRVSTPHGGTFGYPVVNGEWKWRGLDPEELAQRRDSLKLQRKPRDTEKTWRNDQFHAVHTYRVRALPGIPGNQTGELSCSSCHTSLNPPDRLTPRATCGKCHNGQLDPRTGTQVIASDKPNCTSCHVQHMKDKRHWNPTLLTEK